MRSWSLWASACALVFTVACGQTDAGITSSVKAKLAADDTVKAYQVDVDTRDHVVTLSGAVDSAFARERAVVLARETNGVRTVVNNIRIDAAVATSGIDDAADAAARGIRDGADSAADATRRAGSSVNDSDVDDKVEQKAKEGGDAVADGAKKVGTATKKGAEAVADGAKKVGSEVKDVYTDDDPDTDKDG